MAKKRSEVNKEDKWNIEAIFKNDDLWDKEYKALKNDIHKISNYKGRLKDSAKTLKDLIKTDVSLNRRHDEDIKNEKYKSFYDLTYNLFIEYSELSSWITSEILSIDDELINNYINSEELLPYNFFLKRLLRAKEHTLSEKEEKLLSMASNAFITGNCFSALNDADIKFGFITNSKGDRLELTHAKYYVYLINKDRSLREKAFKQYHKKFDEFQMTMTSLLQGKVKEHLFYTKARNFNNTLEATLFYKNIDTTVYTNLIETVRKRIKSLHKYLKYRKEKMGLKELHVYDLYVPIVDIEEIKISYDEAVKALLESVKPLGNEYVNILKQGLLEKGWVDKYENENKRSGAYSTGSYDTMPYILMNYNDLLQSARTLAHEAGHSMHSYYSNKYQPPIYAGYPIFLAEVASTFNEELFNHYLIKNTKDKKQIAYLINSRLEEIRSTLFRQVMFAEFELKIHQLVENNIPLTFQLLKKEYKKLNEFYFGSEVYIDQEIEIEWARIPHFYYNYYVYQYATGISAAIALYKRVINGREKELNDYLNFLKSGGSKFPLDILKDAGINMTTSKPVEETIDYFDELLEKLKGINEK